MIAFRPVLPEEEASCTACGEVKSKHVTGTVWDTMLGYFAQVDEDENGNIVHGSDVNSSHATHFYCYLMYRPGNARIRYGIINAKVAIFSHEKDAWEPIHMNERGLVPMCANCQTPIADETPKKLYSYVNWSYEPSDCWSHEKCTLVCSHCDKSTLANRVIDIGMSDYSWRGCRACFEEARDDDQFFDCRWCGSTWPNEALGWEDNGINTCYACEENVDMCSDCGTWYDVNNDRHYHSVIQDYGTKPRARYYPDGQQFYYLGYELEVEVEEDDDKYNIAEDLLRRVNDSITDSKYLYLKEDGSLDNGFEIVTHPFTLEYHQQFDFTFLEKLMSLGVRSWDRDTCGFHVHVSRSAFTARRLGSQTRNYNKAHELRFTSLIYLNREQFVKFAGRQSNDYASFFSDDTEKTSKHVLMKAKGHENTRFQAVNVQNSNTIEVRIFRGSLRKERVLSYLEMVHACVEYTRSANESLAKTFAKSAPESALDWKRFRSWLVANEKIYPHVNQYLEQLSL